MSYKIIFDNGKPYEEKAKDETELKEKLNSFYCLNANNDYPFNAVVFNEQDEDISESQFITEIIADIIGEENF